MMPKSTATMRFVSGSTKRFPGCKSAWKKPSRKACLRNAVTRLAATSGRSAAASSSAGRSAMGTPPTCAVVRTPAPGALPVHLGDAEGLVPGEVLGQLRGRRGLETQVHLDIDDVVEGAHHGHRLEPAHAGPRALGGLGQPVEEIEVAAEGGLDAGAEDFDGDRRAFGGDRLVDLGDRGRGERRVVETREKFVERAAQPLDQGGAGGGRRERRQPVAQLREVGGGRLAHEVGAGRQKLAELDEARAEVLEGEREPLAGAQSGEIGRRAPAEKPRHVRHQTAQVEGLQGEQRVVAGEGARDPKQTGGVAERAQHLRCARRNAAPRCRPIGCESGPARGRRRRSWRRIVAGRGSAGCSRRDNGRLRRCRSRPRRSRVRR